MLSFPVASVVSAEPVIPREYTPTRAACSRSANSEGDKGQGDGALRLVKRKTFWGEKLHEMKQLGIEYRPAWAAKTT